MAYIAKIKKNVGFLRKLGYSQLGVFCQAKVQLGPNLAPLWESIGGQIGAKIMKKSISTCIKKMFDFLLGLRLDFGRC